MYKIVLLLVSIQNQLDFFNADKIIKACYNRHLHLFPLSYINLPKCTLLDNIQFVSFAVKWLYGQLQVIAILI